MFPLPIITYVKIAVAALCLLGAGYAGYSIEANRFERYKTEQMALVQKAQSEHQQAADQIRIQKDAQIASINSKLADALSQLQQRPSRTQSATNGQSGTGLSLSAEDSQFLVREAARADILRTALGACYQQYDSLNK